MLLDGVDLRQPDLRSLHHHISTVSQAPTLFNASLTDNIGYGAATSQYSMEQVKPLDQHQKPYFLNIG